MTEYLFLTLRCHILEHGPYAFAYFMGWLFFMCDCDATERNAYMATAIGLASR
jgi:hypothetical protein